MKKSKDKPWYDMPLLPFVIALFFITLICFVILDGRIDQLEKKIIQPATDLNEDSRHCEPMNNNGYSKLGMVVVIIITGAVLATFTLMALHTMKMDDMGD